MPNHVIKPERDRDLYIGWSTIVGGPTWLATRDEAIADGVDPTRLDRADRTGTSAFKPVDDGAWDDDTLMAAEPLGCQRLLPREHLAAYALALYEERIGDAFALTMPIEDEEADGG